MRQQMQIPRPTSGYLSATTAAAPKRHNVVSDRTRMTLRTFGGIPSPGVRSMSSQISAISVATARKEEAAALGGYWLRRELLTAIQAVKSGSRDIENKCAKLNHNRLGVASVA